MTHELQPQIPMDLTYSIRRLTLEEQVFLNGELNRFRLRKYIAAEADARSFVASKDRSKSFIGFLETLCGLEKPTFSCVHYNRYEHSRTVKVEVERELLASVEAKLKAALKTTCPTYTCKKYETCLLSYKVRQPKYRKKVSIIFYIQRNNRYV
jgi:hypothetical protein